MAHIESPRSVYTLLAVQHSLERSIKEQIEDPNGIKKALPWLKLINGPTGPANTYLRNEIEKGKEQSLNFALGRKPNLEERVLPEDNPSIELALATTAKSSEEIMEAKFVQGHVVDVFSAKVILHEIDRYTFHGHEDEDKEKTELLESAVVFSKTMGKLQGINYILGNENDGGMTELVEKNKHQIDRFKHPRHP